MHNEHTEKPQTQPESEPRTFLLWGKSTNHLTTVPPGTKYVEMVSSPLDNWNDISGRRPIKHGTDEVTVVYSIDDCIFSKMFQWLLFNEVELYEIIPTSMHPIPEAFLQSTLFESLTTTSLYLHTKQ